MNKSVSLRIFRLVSILALAVFVCHAAVFAQEKRDTEKLYGEIAGDYEFEVEGQVEVLSFFVKDGVLMGRDSSDDSGTPLEPVEGKELEFTAVSDEGQFFEITFTRDENGKITKCKLATMGQEFEGIKAKK